MKIEALDHPKTLDLAAQLQIELPTAIGHLELLWAFVAKKTPQGNIGKYRDGVIAGAAMWRGTPANFVQALVTAGYLDEDADHRLVVHDWPEHCPNWVRSKLKREGLNFCSYDPELSRDLTRDLTGGLSAPVKSGQNRTSVATPSPTSRADLNQAKPREAKPSQATADTHGGEERKGPQVEQFDGWAFVEQVIRPIYPAGTYRDNTWILASKDIERLVEQGEDLALIQQRVSEYAEQQRALGKIGTQFVLSPAKFFGSAGDWRGPFPMPAVQAISGKQAENPEAAEAWERLIASDGADRPPPAAAALKAVGGWSRVNERTTRETPFIRREFIEAYVNAKREAA